MADRPLIFEIPNKLTVYWDEGAKAIIDEWTSYFISLEDFSTAVLIKGLNHSRANGGVAWIVDSSKAIGAFSKEIQAYIGNVIFPAFANNGVKYFITINSDNYLTKMNVDTYAAKTGPNNLQLVEVASVDDAVAWLKTQQNK